MKIAIALVAGLLAASLSFATPFSTATMQPMNEIARQAKVCPILSGAPAPDRSNFTATEPLILSVKLWTDGGLLVSGLNGTLKVLVTEALRTTEAEGTTTVNPATSKSGLVAAVYTTPDGGIWAYAFSVSFWID